MVRPAQGFSGPRVQATSGPQIQFTGALAEAQSFQAAGDAFFGLAMKGAEIVGRQGRAAAAKEGARVAGEATDKSGNPVFRERSVLTSRDEAFNRAGQATYALRVQTSLQKRLAEILKTQRDNPEAIKEQFGKFTGGLRKSVPPEMQPAFDRQAFALSSPHISRAFEAQRRAGIKSNFKTVQETSKLALRDAQELGRNIARGGPEAASAVRSLTVQFSSVIAGIDSLVDGVNLTAKDATIQKRQVASQFAMRLLMGQFQGTKGKTAMLKATASGTLKITVPVIKDDGTVEMKTAPIGKVLDPNDVTRLLGFMRTGISIQKIGTGVASGQAKSDITFLAKAALDGTTISDAARLDMAKRAKAVGGKAGLSLITALSNFDFAGGFRALPLAEMRSNISQQEGRLAGLSETGPKFEAVAGRLDLSRKILAKTQSMVSGGDGIGAGIKAGIVRDIPVSVAGPVKVTEPNGTQRTITAAESLNLRSLMQDALIGQFGSGVSFFRPNERKSIGNIFTSGTVAQRLEVVSALADGVPDSKLPGVLAELAKDQPGLATAVGLASIGQREVAGQLIRGRELRNRKLVLVKWAELDKEAVPALAKLFPALPGGTLDTLGTATRSMLDSVRDGYAYLSAVAGDQANPELDQERLGKAISMVTGGIVERNGGSFIPWEYGMSPTNANGGLDLMQQADWERAGAGSLPVFMRGGKAVEIKPDALRRHARLASIGPGRYFVMFPNPNGDYFPLIHPGSGRRYVLDMTRLAGTLGPKVEEARQTQKAREAQNRNIRGTRFLKPFAKELKELRGAGK